MESERNLEDLVLKYVLAKDSGHIPDHYEHVSSLTVPFYIDGFEVSRVLDVNDAGLVYQLQQNEVSAQNGPDGSVFEVTIGKAESTKFYYVSTNKRFRLFAQIGVSSPTISGLLRIHRESPVSKSTRKFEIPELDELLDYQSEDNSLAIAVAVSKLLVIPGVERNLAKALAEAGFGSIEEVAHTTRAHLAKAIPDLSIEIAEDIINQASFVLEKINSGELDPKGWDNSGTAGKPVRVVKLDSIPVATEEPIRIEPREVGTCTYCSGTLVEDGRGAIYRECGKRE